ncbi:MAG: BatA domain-containing protein [Planctomycetaceae bacterium]
MTLLNPALLSGLLLVLAPVVLHLLLKRKPKPLVFPALRLVMQRRKQNLKRLQLRHIWLLLLRMLAIGLIVFALTRPSLPAADYSFNTREWLTLAAVIAAGVGIYFWRLRQWRQQSLPRHVFALRRASFRGWTTGGTLAALLLVVGCPYQQRIAGELTAPPTMATLDLPVAAVFLFDTSLSMTYQQEGKTRLDVAREIATEHLSELPHGSRVAVADSGSDYPVNFQQTFSVAQKRIQDLTTSGLTLSLSDRLRTCLLAQEEDRRRTLAEQGNVAEEVRKDRFLRRVYIFTDLTKTPWRLGGSTRLQKEIERLQTVGVFVVDVGEATPQNRAVTQIKLSRQQVPVGGLIEVSALLQADGAAAGETTLELKRLLPDGSAIPQGKVQPTLDAGSPTWVTFPLISEATGPVWQGEVRFEASDPLAFDDVRYFSVAVGTPPRVLVSAATAAEAEYWRLLVSPRGVKFRTTFVPASKLRDTDFNQFDVVYLINLPLLADGEWSRLANFVEGGGGVGILLGSDAVKPSGYDRAQAQSFLPMRLEAVRERPGSSLSIETPEHPLWRKLVDDGGASLLQTDLAINRYWLMQPAGGARVLATVTDGDASPLLVERSFGKGRSVVFATDVTLQAGPFRRWNNLANTETLWPVLAFAESLTLYLSRSTDNVFNLTAGEDLVLTLPATEEPRKFLLKRPEYKQSTVSLAAGANELAIADVHDVGLYALADPARPSEPVQGFSVNAAAEESQLTRLTETELDALFGAAEYQVARSIGELDATVNMADLGREVFPIVLLLAIVAFLGEHLVANRFYEADDDMTTSAGATLPIRREVPDAWPPSGTRPSSLPPVASGSGDRVPDPS